MNEINKLDNFYLKNSNFSAIDKITSNISINLDYNQNQDINLTLDYILNDYDKNELDLYWQLTYWIHNIYIDQIDYQLEKEILNKYKRSWESDKEDYLNYLDTLI